MPDRRLGRALQALQIDGTSEQYIQTLPKAGYRFIAPVRVVERGAAGRAGAGPEVGEPAFAGAVHSPATVGVDASGGPDVVAPASETPAPAPADSRPGTRRWPRVLLALGGAAILALVAVPMLRARHTPNTDAGAREFPKRLTNNLASDGMLDWSPDSRHIVFVSGREGKADIFVMDSDGNHVVNPHTGKLNGEVSWSPDGTKLAFQSNRDGNNEIYVAEAIPDTTTRCTSSVAQDRTPSWSPDGSRLVFSSNRSGSRRIFTAPCGEPPLEVATGQLAAHRPLWSPRADRLAFVGDRDGHNDLYLLIGNTVKNLTGGVYQCACAMAWSPNGSRLAVSVAFDGGGEIVILDAEGAFVTRIAHGTRVTRDLSWSPNGSQIAFSAGPHEDSPYNFEIYVIDVDGSRERRLTTHIAYDVQPAWSPDGRHLAFVSERSGDSDVYLMNADGSGVTRVTHTPWAEEGPSWARDGRHLALASGPYENFDIYIYDLSDVLRRMSPSR